MIGTSFETRLYDLDGIVDDSEPERAELRRQQRKRKPLDTNARKRDGEIGVVATISHGSGISVSKTTNVIEISDSDSQPSDSPFTGTETNRASPRIHCPSSSLDSSSRTPAISKVETSTTSSSKPLQTPSPYLLVNDGNEDAGPKRLDLSRFAFANPAANKKTTKLARETTRSALPSSSKCTDRFATKKGVDLDIPSSVLAKISRCVCCDVSWTTRKTGIQKVMHIKSCAKKYAFDNETVQLLIRKEIANFIPIVNPGKGKAKESPPEDSPSKKTYLEEILVDAAPRKRLSAIITATTSEDLDLATNPHESCSGVAGSDGDVNMPSPTQSFGPSALAQLQGATSSTLFSAIYSSPPSKSLDAMDTEISPMRTPTKSRSQTVKRGFSASPPDASYGVEPRTQHCSSDISDVGREVQSNIVPHENDLPLLSYSPPTNSPLPSIEFQSNAKDDDYDGMAFIRMNAPLPTSPAARITKGSKSKAFPASPIPSLDKGNILEKPTPKRAVRTRKKSPAKKTKTVYNFDEKWETHMEEHIVQDSSLHMRILRYEPVHFNVFLELAQLYAPCSGRLKLNLRKYLDKKAIVFYEQLPWGR
ncbi:hypothetical protein BDZ97DRAFT_1911630 [Flammula alnicola]|nr:hypothetical protein BDZ97DRAFT_1911630 [Flammula alnicola]